MAKRAPKCKKGFPCSKACISRNNNCYANLSTENNRIVESFSQFVNRLVGIGNDTRSAIKNDSSEKSTKIKKPSSTDEQKLKDKFNNDKYLSNKLKKVIEEYPELSELEAMGVSLWISMEYKKMNYLLYSEDIADDELENLGEFIAANYHAAEAIRSGKIPRYTREKMEDFINNSDNYTPLDSDGILSRGLQANYETMNRLSDYYANKIGEEIIEETFFATTAYKANEFGFTYNAPVLYRVTPKKESNGVMVDQGKINQVEAEVLYAPGTRFKVISVEKPKFKNHTLDEVNDIIKNTKKISEDIKKITKLDNLDDFTSIKLMLEIAGANMDKLSIDEFLWGMDFNFSRLKIPKELLIELYEYSKSLSGDDIDLFKTFKNKGNLALETGAIINLQEI